MVALSPELSRRLSAALAAGGAAAVVASGLLPWLELGSSTLSGFRLADLIVSLGDDVGPAPPSWIGVAWYGIPVLAVVGWLTVFFPAPPAARRSHVVIGAICAGGGLFYAFVSSRYQGVPMGPLITIIGGAAMAVAGLGVRRRTP
ncbi:MAG: hypothetical protein OEU32_03135 [Acidimicrobiia bacterium]|nr:hypothetical protein [Acidimicrobiia bacterium]